MKQYFCILGNAMNAKHMKLGEDISPLNFGIAFLCVGLLVLFITLI